MWARLAAPPPPAKGYRRRRRLDLAELLSHPPSCPCTEHYARVVASYGHFRRSSSPPSRLIFEVRVCGLSRAIAVGAARGKQLLDPNDAKWGEALLRSLAHTKGDGRTAAQAEALWGRCGVGRRRRRSGGGTVWGVRRDYLRKLLAGAGVWETGGGPPVVVVGARREDRHRSDEPTDVPCARMTRGGTVTMPPASTLENWSAPRTLRRKPDSGSYSVCISKNNVSGATEVSFSTPTAVGSRQIG